MNPDEILRAVVAPQAQAPSRRAPLPRRPGDDGALSALEARLVSDMGGGAEESARAAVELARYREIRSGGKVFGTERIAVMAALNITHELLERDTMSDATSSLLRAMDSKLNGALGDGSGR